MRTVLFQLFLCLAISAVRASPADADPGWFWQNPLPQGNSLRGVASVDAQTAIAVGDFGTILRTTNSGLTIPSSGTSNHLAGVSLVAANVGTAVGDFGAILRTTDGGATWRRQSSGTTNLLWGVAIVDVNTETVVGEGGTILRTNTGGE